MSHPNNPVVTRRRGGTAPTRSSRFVRVGEKETYDPANPADFVEYRTVTNYRRR